MKKIVVIPSDPLECYIKNGLSVEWLNAYYNPNGYFDEVYCLSPWGGKQEWYGKINCIRKKPSFFSKVISEIGPDIVRAYDGFKCADWASVNKVNGIPTIVSVHDKRESLIRESLAYADGVICVSNAVKEAVLENTSVQQEQIYLCPNRIDTDCFSKKLDVEYFKTLEKKYGNKKHILHVGRKTEQKNLDTLLRALVLLGKDFSCIFVGRGDTATYELLAEKLGVREQCFFVESVENDELPYYYSWCDCMCTPSRTEGFGFVFVEAAACEAIVVTSDIAPMNEYFQDNVNAILVKDFNDPNDVAIAIKRAMSKDESVELIKKRARDVGLKFSREKIASQEIDIYEQVMSKGANNKKNRNLATLFNVWKFR